MHLAPWAFSWAHCSFLFLPFWCMRFRSISRTVRFLQTPPNRRPNPINRSGQNIENVRRKLLNRASVGFSSYNSINFGRHSTRGRRAPFIE